jgi:hypothetical protein
MDADTTQANNTYGWLADTGAVSRYSTGSSTWTAVTNYWTAMAIPYSLHGRISAISSDGRTLTLKQADGSTDATATVTATNANVYLDNQPLINYITGRQSSTPGYIQSLVPITPTDMIIIIPEGSFAISGRIRFRANDGWTLKGRGKTSTYLFSPDGVYSGHVNAGGDSFSPTQISDFTLTGNWARSGYGLNIAGWTYIPGGYDATGMGNANADTDDGQGLTQTNIPGGLTFPPGVYVAAVTGTVIQDIAVVNVSQKAVGADQSTNVWAYRCTYTQTDYNPAYIQWAFQWGDCTNGGCEDCTITSTYAIGGFESFNSTGHQFIRLTTTNAGGAQNNSQDYVMEDCSVTFTSGYENVGWATTNPMVNINTNNGSNNVANGGTVDNITLVTTYDGSAENNLCRGIVVNASNPNITITGGSYTAPDYLAPSTFNGPIGIQSTGPSTTVSGFSACGALKAGAASVSNANIGVAAGSVTGCIADVIVVTSGTNSGNIACP